MPGPPNHLPVSKCGFNKKLALQPFIHSGTMTVSPTLSFFSRHAAELLFVPNTSHEVKDIQVILLFCVLKAAPKKDPQRVQISLWNRARWRQRPKSYLLPLSHLMKITFHSSQNFSRYMATQSTPLSKNTLVLVSKSCWERRCTSLILVFGDQQLTTLCTGRRMVLILTTLSSMRSLHKIFLRRSHQS